MKLAILAAIVAYTSMSISYCNADSTFATAVCHYANEAKMCIGAINSRNKKNTYNEMDVFWLMILKPSGNKFTVKAEKADCKSIGKDIQRYTEDMCLACVIDQSTCRVE